VNRVYRWSAGHFEPAGELRYDFSALILPIEEILTVKWGRIVDGDFWTLSGRRIVRYPKSGGVQIFDEQNGLHGKPVTL
jgi:hypothetical protein